MAKKWVYKYGEHTIKVVKKGLKGSELYVDDVLKDQAKKMEMIDRLSAELDTGETFYATLDGLFSTNCFLVVGKQQEPVSVA